MSALQSDASFWGQRVMFGELVAGPGSHGDGPHHGRNAVCVDHNYTRMYLDVVHWADRHQKRRRRLEAKAARSRTCG